jgi:RHS repeat-associated protein
VGPEGVLTNHRTGSGGILSTDKITKNGYLYVYCSNESQVDVFFDNLQVIHTRGQILEETHYYPFGLTMAGISSKALNGAVENRRKFNDGTERSTDFDLSWDETDCRTYDPQIGRFLQIDPLSEISDHLSPFVYASNNPVLRNDPFGLKDTTVNGQSATTKVLDEIVVTGKKPKPAPQSPVVNSTTTAGAMPLPIGPLPGLSPVNPPGKIIPFNRPVGNPGVGTGLGLLSRFLGTFAAVIWPSSTVGAGSDFSHPFYSQRGIAPYPGFAPFPGHGNNKDNSNPHIVYQFTFTPSDDRTPVLKYGISDEYRNGWDRPENQQARLLNLFGASVTLEILTRTINREQALMIEQTLVDRHYGQWGESPRDQIRPIPSPLK